MLTTKPAAAVRETVVAIALIAVSVPLFAQDFRLEFPIDRCELMTVGTNPYFPLIPGTVSYFSGEEDGELVELRLSVLDETRTVAGVETRVVEELEMVDGELAEISLNYYAMCKDTHDVYYFGEDVENFEDGAVVDTEGSWRAGEVGALPGLIMPGLPIPGARYYQEVAPGVALDRGEIEAVDDAYFTDADVFIDVVRILDTSALDPAEESTKRFAPGVGLIQDDDLELDSLISPPCVAVDGALCLNDWRFHVEATWAAAGGNSGAAQGHLTGDDSGVFWFFDPSNTELQVKVLDACELADFGSFWVFASGLTNVEVSLRVTDTQSGTVWERVSPLGQPYEPILDTSAFDTCP